MSRPFAPPDAPPSVLPRWNPFAVLMLMLMLMFVWRFTIECGLGLLIVAMALINGVPVQTLTDNPESLLRADVLAIGTTVQLVGMVVLIGLCLRIAGAEMRESFATRGTRWPLFGIAALSGLVVGLFPSWINERLIELMPNGNMALQQQIADSLSEGPMLGRVLMVGAVAVIAPLFEELAFRGGLWIAVERASHRMLGDRPERLRTAQFVTFIVTSLMFAAYHLDPVHVLSLLPTAFLLGWLRLTSGSVWPGVLCHFANNGLAVLMVQFLDDSGGSTPLWLALLSLTATLTFGALAWAMRAQESA